MKSILTTLVICFFTVVHLFATEHYTAKYNPVWTTPSSNSFESMPCGGGDIGLNVWVEDGDFLFYMQQSGAFDENNTFLKAGRVRVQLNPNPFDGYDYFKQELVLENGYVEVSASKGNFEVKFKVWVDVFHSVVHVDVESNKPVEATAAYESWRYQDQKLCKLESFQNSYKWAPPKGLLTKKDEIAFSDNKVCFCHQNKGETIFDVVVEQQGLDSVKDQLFNPLNGLISGGCMYGKNFVAAGQDSGKYLNTSFQSWKLKSKKTSKHHSLMVVLVVANEEQIANWQQKVRNKLNERLKTIKSDKKTTQAWWFNFWNRSYIQIQSSESDTSKMAQVARNYQLFRYMLGCNAYGKYPTKFNGGLFTVDPVFTKSDRAFTPDFRNWGGGTFTAQNQRLVYFPMFKSGDTDMLESQLDFYLRILKNAELRSKVYWRHDGACYTEQIENFGLPNPSEYGWKRPDWYDKGMQYNAWLEYQWDTALEICYMALQQYTYAGDDITEYIPMIESCLTFFDEHYQYLAAQRGRKKFDGDCKLILFPGSSCETYKMTNNSTSTIAALTVVTRELLNLPDCYVDSIQRKKWAEFADRIPEISFREIDGHTTISPAKTWERINNVESPQLYPVFPWGIYGVGKFGLDTAINTWNYDPDVKKFRSHIGWKQDAIWAARLGLTDEASRLVQLKLCDSDNRFTAFWGPGFDWTPDHNWGGSGMIALQEMLLQTNGDSILLFPAWPKQFDVRFKLHAPDNTTIEAELKDGKVVKLEITPAAREKDVAIWE